jgi:hypothetical protein
VGPTAALCLLQKGGCNSKVSPIGSCLYHRGSEAGYCRDEGGRDGWDVLPKVGVGGAHDDSM